MTLTHQNIEQLLSLCVKGNQQAQMEIYNRYYKAMYNTAYRIVRNSFDAEDIMQESFLKTFYNLQNMKNKPTFGAWLKRIVINNSIQFYNKLKANKEVDLDDKLYKMKLEGENESMDNESETSQKVKMVMASLKDLKENYRMGLTLHLIEGYDYEEISEIMNISNGNCRTLISRAKESLRKKLEPITN